MKKIGILGGTFDPIHNGHLQLAKSAQTVFQLDEILLIPSGQSYMKKGVTGANCRLEMVQKAILHLENFNVSDIETKRIGKSYTSDTVLELMKQNSAEYYYIIGADTLFMIEYWKSPEILFANLHIIVAGRQGYENSELEEKVSELRLKYHADIQILYWDNIAVSSTRIREQIANNSDDLSLLIPKEVENYIKEHHLYGYQQERFCDEICKSLQTKMKTKRYLHTMGVAKTAIHLAQIYGEDVYKAQIAGLLHDCAKMIDDDEKIALCAKYSVPVSDVERNSPDLLHAKVGSIIAKKDYEISDDAILNAIYWHTTGHPQMTMLEKIIYIADYIEPQRDFSERLPELRKLANEDLDKTLLHILRYALEYLTKEKIEIDPMTIETLQYYEQNE